jgi:hypothetical protein
MGQRFKGSMNATVAAWQEAVLPRPPRLNFCRGCAGWLQN